MSLPGTEIGIPSRVRKRELPNNVVKLYVVKLPKTYNDSLYFFATNVMMFLLRLMEVAD